MNPWKYPKMMEMGRNTMSLGFFRNSPTSLTTLVKQNMKMSSAAKSVYRLVDVQFSVPHQHENRIRGSVIKANEVNVAK
jgi:hypothetical protein